MQDGIKEGRAIGPGGVSYRRNFRERTVIGWGS